MRGLSKSKRVSWASDPNLCQVKLFLSDEAPSQIGLISGEDHLQAKSLWNQQSIGTGLDENENLPPGFEGPRPTSSLKNKLSQIHVIKWRCPPKFMLDLNWLVVSGEESQEVDAQNQREMRVLEAIYPRASAIPPDPSPLLNMEDFSINDKNTPLIPITPIEDEEAIAEAPFANDSTNQFNPMNSNGIASTSEPDVVSAAYNALTSVMPSGDSGLIDHDLLVKILSDPKKIENLLADHRSSTNSPSFPNPMIHMADSNSNPNPNPNQMQVSRNEAAAAAAPFYHIPSNRMGPIPGPGPGPGPGPSAPLSKNMNYYKNLIQQHGGERTTDNIPPPQFSNRQDFSNHRPRDSSKPKIMKPCMFFNSSRGCRHGANCAFQHEPSPQQQRASNMNEVQASKRSKFDREITG